MAGFLPCVVLLDSRCGCRGSVARFALGALLEEYIHRAMANYEKETKSEGKTAIKTNIITLALMVIKTV